MVAVSDGIVGDEILDDIMLALVSDESADAELREAGESFVQSDAGIGVEIAIGGAVVGYLIVDIMIGEKSTGVKARLGTEDMLPGLQINIVEDRGYRNKLVIERRIGRINHLDPFAQFVAVLEMDLVEIIVVPCVGEPRFHGAGLGKVAVVFVGIQNVPALGDATILLIGQLGSVVAKIGFVLLSFVISVTVPLERLRAGVRILTAGIDIVERGADADLSVEVAGKEQPQMVILLHVGATLGIVGNGEGNLSVIIDLLARVGTECVVGRGKNKVVGFATVEPSLHLMRTEEIARVCDGKGAALHALVVTHAQIRCVWHGSVNQSGHGIERETVSMVQ